MKIQRHEEFIRGYQRRKESPDVKIFHRKVSETNSVPDLERWGTSLFSYHLKQLQQSLRTIEHLPLPLSLEHLKEEGLNETHSKRTATLSSSDHRRPPSAQTNPNSFGSTSGLHLSTYAYLSLKLLQNQLQSGLNHLMTTRALQAYKENL